MLFFIHLGTRSVHIAGCTPHPNADWMKQQARNLSMKLADDQTPMCNAYAERFVREARETLDNIIPFGERHFRHVLKCIKTHHNQQRPHQGINNLLPDGFDYPDKPASSEDICCQSLLGGLINHYYVKKAA